eukprot:1713363-Rhodomonas_salina.4
MLGTPPHTFVRRRQPPPGTWSPRVVRYTFWREIGRSRNCTAAHPQMAHSCKRIRIEGHAGTLAEQERQVDERLNALRSQNPEEFEKDAKKRAKKRKRVEDIVNAAKKQADDIVDHARKCAEGIANTAKKQADDARKYAEGIANAAKKQADDIVDHARKCAEGIANAAKKQAEDIVNHARKCAEGIENTATKRAEDIVEERQNALELLKEGLAAGRPESGLQLLANYLSHSHSSSVEIKINMPSVVSSIGEYAWMEAVRMSAILKQSNPILVGGSM